MTEFMLTAAGTVTRSQIHYRLNRDRRDAPSGIQMPATAPAHVAVTLYRDGGVGHPWSPNPLGCGLDAGSRFNSGPSATTMNPKTSVALRKKAKGKP